MKKLMFLTIAAIVMSNCEVSVKPKSVTAQSKFYKPVSDHQNYFLLEYGGNGVNYGYAEWNDMRYVIIHEYNGGLSTINLTKDALEVELLRKQLKSTK